MLFGGVQAGEPLNDVHLLQNEALQEGRHLSCLQTVTAARLRQHRERYAALPVDAQGKRMVAQGYRDPLDGFKLGVWQHTQRSAMRAESLTRERAARLDSIG